MANDTPIKVAIIGLDTSHSVEFPKLMLDKKVEEAYRVPGLLPTRALRFDTPFQSKAGLDERQAYLESLGMMVTEDFDTAVADCDAVLLEINDASFHLPYFRKCVDLGKPVFLDKPFADTLENSRIIRDLAAQHNVPFFTASCLRFCQETQAAHKAVPAPMEGMVWGPVGKAAAGSSIVWYGVHAVEMIQLLMGRGARTVQVTTSANGYLLSLGYGDERKATVSLTQGLYDYGGLLRTPGREPHLFHEPITEHFYRPLLLEIESFLRTGKMPVGLEDGFEVMAILEAAERSVQSGGMPQLIYTR